MKAQCSVTQGFGYNANGSYAAAALKGHTGVDESCGYGSPIYAYHDGYVYKVLDQDHPANDGSGFTGVFVIVEENGEVFEFLYGHCDPLVKVGDLIKKGDLIGTEANNGEVYSGGVRITLEMQKAGDRRGSHRHSQKRLVKKVGQLTGQCLTAYNGLYRDSAGYFYAIVNFENGYNGCVDWLTEAIVIENLTKQRDLLQKVVELYRKLISMKKS